MKTPFKNGQRVWWKDPAGDNSGCRTISCDVQNIRSGTDTENGHELKMVVTDDSGTKSEVYAHELEPLCETTYEELLERERGLRHDMELCILQLLRQNRGRMSLTVPKQNDDEWEEFEFPVTTALYGRHSTDNVDITSIYVEPNHSDIYADGMVAGCPEKGYRLYPEQYSDALWFIVHVLRQQSETDYDKGSISQMEQGR